MQQPRSAGAMGTEFPYKLRTMCYIEVSKDGSVSWGDGADAYHRAVRGKSSLYAVWPGEYSSHLFHIDDLDEYARGKGMVHDAQRSGLEEHDHEVRWHLSPYEDKPTATYISVDVWLDCGCMIRDLASFAAQMRRQKGWDIATSGGWGSSTSGNVTRYSLRVRRRSMNSSTGDSESERVDRSLHSAGPTNNVR